MPDECYGPTHWQSFREIEKGCNHANAHMAVIDNEQIDKMSYNDDTNKISDVYKKQSEPDRAIKYRNDRRT